MIDIRIQAADFDPARQMARLEAVHAHTVASFVALAQPERGDALLVDHHPAMAKREMAAIASEANARWPLFAIIMIRRHGRIERDSRLGFIGIAAVDGDAAIDACAFIRTEMRKRAPLWHVRIATDEAS